MKATNQLWRHRTGARAKLGHAHSVRLRDNRVGYLSNQPTPGQFGGIGTHLLEPHVLERGNGDLSLHAVLAYQICCPLREGRGAPLDLGVDVYPSLISCEHLIERGDPLACKLRSKPRARIESSQRSQRMAHYRAGTVSGPIYGIVVDDDDVAIAGN